MSVGILQHGILEAEASPITWTTSYGGNDLDEAFSIQQTTDGGYILGGETESFGTSQDLWIVKLNATGRVEWEKTYGGSSTEYMGSVRQTPDGGYIVAGATESFGGDAQRNVWLLKLDSDGGVEWEQQYGGIRQDHGLAVEVTSDGGFVIIAETYSFGSGSNDAWVVKTDSDGNVEWQKAYGNPNSDFLVSIKQTSDGGYIAAGLSNSEGRWLLKLEPDGDIDWEKRFAGDVTGDAASDAEQTSDGGYVLSGDNGGKLWIARLDADGDAQWERNYGDGREPSIYPTQDGGYVVTARVTLFGGGMGQHDLRVMKLDSDGAIEWQRAYGAGESHDYPARTEPVQETSDGGFVVAGNTDYEERSTDFWVLKLDENGNIDNCDGDFARDTNYKVSDAQSTLDTISTTVDGSDGSIIATEATVRDTEAILDNPCDRQGSTTSSLQLFEDFDEPSDGVVNPGDSVRVVAETLDSSVTSVTFRWLNQSGDLVHEATSPISAPEDTFIPEDIGTWTIEADFGNGEIIRETLNVPFFVLPESPLGSIALVLTAMSSLGFFLYVRGTKGGRPTT